MDHASRTLAARVTTKQPDDSQLEIAIRASTRRWYWRMLGCHNRWRFEMFERLEHLEAKYEDVTRLISDPEILADPAKYQKHTKTTG